MAQDIIGRAWIGVGIRDDTGPGLDRIERGLRQRRATVQATLQGTGGFGAGRPGGRESGAFGGWNQLAFGIEDAVVSAQLNGFSGAMRASANNITMLALAFGGLRAQMLATAFVVVAQLAPAVLKLVGYSDPIANTMSRLNEQAKGFRDSLQTLHDAAGMQGRIDALMSSDAGVARSEALLERIGQLQNVERPALLDQLQHLHALRLGQVQSDDNEWITTKLGETFGEYVAGLESDEQRMEVIRRETAVRERALRNLDEQVALLQAENAAVHKHTVSLSVAERQIKEAQQQLAARGPLSNMLTGLAGDLSALIGPKAAATFAAEQRNRQLSDLFDKAGVDGSGLLLQLSQLDRLRLNSGHGFRLPDALDQFSVAGQKQFALNQGTQNDPALAVQQEIKREAQNIVRKLDEVLDALTE